MRAKADLATSRQGGLAVRAVLAAFRDLERLRCTTRRIARGRLVWSGGGRLRRPCRRPTRGAGSAGLRTNRSRRLRHPSRSRRGQPSRSAIQLLQRFRRQRDVRRREVANARRIRARRSTLGAEYVAHLSIHDQVATGAAEQLHQRELIILVGLHAQLATMEPVREDVLVEFPHLERLCEVTRIAGAYRPHEVAVHRFDVIHSGSCEVPLSRVVWLWCEAMVAPRRMVCHRERGPG